ncbi:MAG: serine protease [Gemmatimonadota bacterium]|nr:serine protease [Gemmatimonadota bacterium]
MPTWGELIPELQAATAQHGPLAFDITRRKYLTALSAHTGRNTILYATKWTQAGGVDPGLVSISLADVQGLMEVVHGLDGRRGLDLVLHSPGGSPDAAEAVVHYLRSKFDDIRVIVPQAAMSAATMLACAANRIIMGKHSSLGPIDPQFLLPVPNGMTMAHPAQAILDQFDLAKEECKDPALLGAWIPILPQYGPSLLIQCYNALDLAEELVAEWLRTWMLAPLGAKTARRKAKAIATWLSDHTSFKSHGRPIHRDLAKAKGLVVDDLEHDQVLQDLVLTVFHATTHTFGATPAAKIVENHLGRAFVLQQSLQNVQLQLAAPPQQPAGVPAR